jgi:hypothetical protein
MKFWRVTEEAIDPTVYGADGKWRFMVHDFDISYENTNHNTLYLSTMQKDADTASRHPKFATDLFEYLFKNETFRTEFAQRSMVYLRTFMRGTSISAILDEMVAEREAGKAADIARWSLGTIDNWKNNVNGLKTFAVGRPSPLREQYMNLFNSYYNAGITGTCLFNITGDEAEINGGKVQDGDELKMFTGIPVTIKAEGAYIVAIGDSVARVNFGELTFTPNGDYKITIEKPEAAIVKAEVKSEKLTAWVEISKVSYPNAKLYVAGYSKDNEVIFAKTLDIDNPTTMVPPAEEYKLFLWDGLNPVTQSYTILPKDEDNKVEDPAEGDFDEEADELSY